MFPKSSVVWMTRRSEALALATSKVPGKRMVYGAKVKEKP